MDYPSLTTTLDERCHDDRYITFVDSGDEKRQIKFDELRRRALLVLNVLQQRGVEPGQHLIVVLGSNERFLDAFWACLYGGIVAVPIAPGVSAEQRQKLLRVYSQLGAPYLYTDQGQWARIQEFARTSLDETALRELQARTVLSEHIEATDPAARIAAPERDSVAFIQYSSGSTSEPKGIVLTHGNLMANIADIRQAAQFTAADRSLSWMPLTHDMGLIGFHLNMLASGMDHALMSTELFIRRPLMWLQVASAERSNVLCSPNFGYRHFLNAFRPNKMDTVDLTSVRLIFNGAEPISSSLADEFLTTLAPYGLAPRAMFPVYGLAEASLAVSFPPLNRPMQVRRIARTGLAVGDMVQDVEHNAFECVSVGRPIGSCEVCIADAEDRPLEPGRIGRILIRGPNVTGSFFTSNGLVEATRHADGWVDTGDLGFVVEDELYIAGRSKDVIFVNGQNYYAHDLENTALAVGGVELGKIAISAIRRERAEEDEIIAFVQHRGALEQFAPIAASIAREINERTGAPLAAVVPVPRIPKTTSGKVQRFVLANDYVNGAFDDSLQALSAMQASVVSKTSNLGAVEQILQDICDRVLGPGVLGREDNFFEIGTNSLKLIEIHELIEQQFPGRLEVTDLFDYPNLVELSAYLEDQD